MSIEHINPPTLMKPQGYSQLVVASGSKTVYVAGQGAYDAEGKLVGAGDHYAQTKQAFTNLLTALEAVGGTAAHIVKATIYVVGSSEAMLGDFARGMNDAMQGAPMPPTASTFVGVERLAFDEMLVEIDAIAVIE